jgi:hypothetical protein
MVLGNIRIPDRPILDRAAIRGNFVLDIFASNIIGKT